MLSIPLLFGPKPLADPEVDSMQPVISAEEALGALMPSEPSGNGLLMSFDFVFPDSKGTVVIRLEGDFVEVEETWTPTSNRRVRWGTERARLVFDNREKVLTVINKERNTYTELDETDVSQIRRSLREHRPVDQYAVTHRSTSSRIEDDKADPDDNPTYIAIPEKPHPKECLAYERPLPKGLHEESCYKPWKLAGVRPANLNALKSLRKFVRGLDEPLSELGVVSAVSDALAWDLGLVVSQYKYGKSPLAPTEETTELDPWDRVFTLKEVRPDSFTSADLRPPKTAIQEYGIVPWPTPLINL